MKSPAVRSVLHDMIAWLPVGDARLVLPERSTETPEAFGWVKTGQSWLPMPESPEQGLCSAVCEAVAEDERAERAETKVEIPAANSQRVQQNLTGKTVKTQGLLPLRYGSRCFQCVRCGRMETKFLVRPADGIEPEWWRWCLECRKSQEAAALENPRKRQRELRMREQKKAEAQAEKTRRLNKQFGTIRNFMGGKEEK